MTDLTPTFVYEHIPKIGDDGGDTGTSCSGTIVSCSRMEFGDLYAIFHNDGTKRGERSVYIYGNDSPLGVRPIISLYDISACRSP